MRYKFILLNILLILAFSARSQTLTGIWRGYFAQSNFGFYDERYKFEVQINQLPNKALSGVTYSYKTTVFFGKAVFKGIYTPTTKNVIFNELNLVELKIDGQSSPCLMTCYLEYSKMGNLETLTGTYTSRTVKTKGDCGEGKVYLERTTTTDFQKEDFLVKKEKENEKIKPPAPKAPVVKPRFQPSQNTAKNKPVIVTKKPVTGSHQPVKPRIKPGAEDALTKAPAKKQADTIVRLQPPVVKEDHPIPKSEPVKPPVILLPKPEILKRRSNELVKTIYTSAREVKIELYDNGEIDGDTISVYHNNRLIASKKRLSDKPITFNIKTDENVTSHEFVMVAENLGLIPPNTALMVITAGGKRYELFITSTEQKNAVVDIEYKPQNQP